MGLVLGAFLKSTLGGVEFVLFLNFTIAENFYYWESSLRERRIVEVISYEMVKGSMCWGIVLEIVERKVSFAITIAVKEEFWNICGVKSIKRSQSRCRRKGRYIKSGS